MFRHLNRAVLLAACLAFVSATALAGGGVVRIGLNLEVGDVTSTSDDAVRLGVEQAIAEINRDGGVLGGRRLEMVVTDNRSVPARGVRNLQMLAEMDDMTAVMVGKFSPVALEMVKHLPVLQMPLLDPWAAADGIVANGQTPNWAFRLSLSDSMAVGAVLRHLKARGLTKLGVLLPNIAWGRSNDEALKAKAKASGVSVVATEWYNWGGDSGLKERYAALRRAGAQAVFLVANEREGAQFVQDLASLNESERLPVVSHWGVTGGDFWQMCGPALQKIDFVVVQTFTLAQARGSKGTELARKARDAFGVDHVERVPSAVGVAHAYDLTYLLVQAIELAGSTDRAAIRSALEHLGTHNGVVKRYVRPFTPLQHEALTEKDLFFARFRPDGRLSRIAGR